MARRRVEVVFEFEDHEAGALLVEATHRNLWECGCRVDVAIRCTIRSIVYEAIQKSLPRDEAVNLEWAGMTDEAYREMVSKRTFLLTCYARGVGIALQRARDAVTEAGTMHWLGKADMAQARIGGLPG